MFLKYYGTIKLLIGFLCTVFLIKQQHLSYLNLNTTCYHEISVLVYLRFHIFD